MCFLSSENMNLFKDLISLNLCLVLRLRKNLLRLPLENAGFTRGFLLYCSLLGGGGGGGGGGKVQASLLEHANFYILRSILG